MASMAFFDPIVLFRLAPLVSSTFALRFSVDQYSFLNAFLAPEHRETAKGVIPSYFRVFFRRGIWHIGVLYTLSLSTGFANFLSSRPSGGGAWKWYAAGTAFTLAHMAFVPKIMWSVKAPAQGSGRRGVEKMAGRPRRQSSAGRLPGLGLLRHCLCKIGPAPLMAQALIQSPAWYNTTSLKGKESVGIYLA